MNAINDFLFVVVAIGTFFETIDRTSGFNYGFFVVNYRLLYRTHRYNTIIEYYFNESKT